MHTRQNEKSNQAEDLIGNYLFGGSVKRGSQIEVRELSETLGKHIQRTSTRLPGDGTSKSRKEFKLDLDGSNYVKLRNGVEGGAISIPTSDKEGSISIMVDFFNQEGVGRRDELPVSAVRATLDADGIAYEMTSEKNYALFNIAIRELRKIAPAELEYAIRMRLRIAADDFGLTGKVRRDAELMLIEVHGDNEIMKRTEKSLIGASLLISAIKYGQRLNPGRVALRMGTNENYLVATTEMLQLALSKKYPYEWHYSASVFS